MADSNITAARAAAFKQQIDENQAAVAGLPPAYLAGFDPSVGEDGHLTVGSGVAAVNGRQVAVRSTLITESMWEVNRIGSFTYYLYLDQNGVFHVDVLVPVYQELLFYRTHKVYAWRYILTLKLNSDLEVQWANKLLEDEIAAQKLTFAKSVGSQTRKDPESGDVRTYMGMDPEGDQVAGTDLVEIAIKEHNGERFENRFSVAMRSGVGVADAFVSGFFQAGDRVISQPGVLWIEGTNNFSGSVTAMAFGNGYVVAGTLTSEIERSADGGKTFGADISNSHTDAIRACAFGNGVFIMVGDSGEISRSTDAGASWSSLVSNAFATASDDIRGIAYDQDDGVWVIVGDGTTSILRSSNDGVTWSSPTTAPTANLNKIVYIRQSTFVATSHDADNVYISTDAGDSWSVVSIAGYGAGDTGGIAYGNGVLVLSLNIPLANYYYSVDRGQTWVAATQDTANISAGFMIYGADVFLGGNQRSYDTGRTFEKQTIIDGTFSYIASGTYDTTLMRIAVGSDSGVTFYSDWLEAGAGIVAQGTNSNGSYKVFSSGEQECRYQATSNTTMSTSGGPLSSYYAIVTLTFPRPFASAPVVAPACINNAAFLSAAVFSVSATQVQLLLFGTNGATAKAGYIASGVAS